MKSQSLCVPLLILLCLIHSAFARDCDVLVYGATPGGFCAAIAAAREGANVVLLEPTSHIGGVNTGGLSFSDSNQTVRSTLTGLFEEWHLRIAEDYQRQGIKLPYDVHVKDQSVWTYEPSVAARVTRQMLREAGVSVIPNSPFLSVEVQGTRIATLQTDNGDFSADVYVDATYEGDLLAAAGVSWAIGRDAREDFDEPLAGKQYPKSKMPISGTDHSGEPLPLITTTDAGEPSAGDQHVMVYSFRLCLTKDPEIKVPFPQPAHYDPRRFEVIRRYFVAEKRPILLWDIYALPNGKFDANNGIGKQFSMGLVGAGDDWSTADASKRRQIWEAHRQYTLELYHFLTTDPTVPEHLRSELAEYGLCSDEFTEHDHWSPQLYVREGRRMQGAYILTQHDIMESPQKPDPIAISSFPIDSHDCQRVALEDGVINEGTIFPVRMPRRRHGYPYQVPYRSLTPQADECTNLLVPVALSSTHVAFSSIRVEPTWMTLGQSAGIAAALAVKLGCTVQALPYPKLRERLLAQGQTLALPVLPEIVDPPAPTAIDPDKLPGIVLDDAAAKLKGTWSTSRNFPRHVGQGYLHDDQRSDGNSVATFTTTVPRSGRYQLRMAYSAHPTRSKQVPLRIRNGDQTTEITVDQTQPLPADAAFRAIGEVTLASEAPTVITISNENTHGFVIVDALQLIRIEDE